MRILSIVVTVLCVAAPRAAAQIPPGTINGAIADDAKPLKGDATYCVTRDSGGDQLEMKFEERLGARFDIRATRGTLQPGVYLLVPEQRDSQLVASYHGRDGRSDPAIPSGRVVIDSVTPYLMRGSLRLDAVPDRSSGVVLPITGNFDALNSCATWAVMAQYDADQVPIKKRQAEERARAEAKANRQRRAARTASLRAKGWSQRAITAVLDGQVYLGMTKEMVRSSWGDPEDINRTITAVGVHEQWVYGDSYVYFDDGKVTAIQD